MASGRAFDEFGRIISGKGELAAAEDARGIGGGLLIGFLLGRRIVGGELRLRRIETRILNRLKGRFPRLSDAQLVRLLRIAREGIASAEKAKVGPADIPIPLGDIPVQPALFGDEPAGRRVLFSADVQIEKLDRSIRIDLELADTESLVEIERMLREEATSRIQDSPKAFGLDVNQEVTAGDINIKFIERRF